MPQLGRAGAARAHALLPVCLFAQAVAKLELATPLQVGAWMLYATWGLVVAIRDGTVAQHPLFCYEEASGPEGVKTGYEGWTGQAAAT